MVEAATRQAIPLFCTPLETTEAIFKVSQFLEWQFAPRINVHGSFVDVYGVGLLFIGRSGIGKSEIVLDLVERGHRLVADDVVVLTRKRDGVIVGSGTNLVRHFMEIRGLGLIDIRQMFGVRAIRNQKRLEIIVQLEEWDSNVEYTRTGLDAEPLTILDTNVDFVRLPITPGKNVTVIAEVIAMSYLLNQHGYNSAAEFSRKLTDEIRKKSRSPKEGSDRDPDIYLYDVDTE
jgi:HPr kinase/phosphorylase